METLLEGLVVRSQSRSFTVRVEGEDHLVLIPKRFRYENPEVVDPMAVGDRVRFTPGPETGVIEEILPRRNSLSRPASGRAGKRQMLAANLDRIVIVVAARDPVYKTATLDRYLVMASLAGVPALLVMNKIDVDPAVREDPDLSIYTDLGIPWVFVSATLGTGLQDLAARLAGGTAVFIGPSGAGKSSLLNRLDPASDVRTGEVSDQTGKGRHTTTWVEMIDLPGGGRLIDSPGLRVLDLSGLDPEDLARHFPEMEARLGDCRFQDCRHLAEPGCAVKAAVEAGEIREYRYDSYQKIYQSLSRGTG